MQLSKELTELQERLSERDDEIGELKAERNNTRVSQSVSLAARVLCDVSPSHPGCITAGFCWSTTPRKSLYRRQGQNIFSPSLTYSNPI